MADADAATRARVTRRAFTLAAMMAMTGSLLVLVGGARLREYLGGLAFDLAFVVLVHLLAEAAAWLRAPRPLIAALQGATLTVAVGLVFAHAWFYDVAIERRLTLLDVSFSGLQVFFFEALSAAGRWTLVALAPCFALLVLALRRLRRAPSRPLAWLVALAACATASMTLGLPRSPLYDSAEEAWLLVRMPPVTAAAGPEQDGWVASFDKSARTEARGTPRFRKVIVLVMETMPARTFDAENAALAADAFPRREAAHLRRFTRYYPNNQDSRTGMLDMLFSRVIPYEAYSDAGHAGYAHLAHAPSLVDQLRALGYRSAFAVAQTELEEVVADLSWDATLRLNEAEIAVARAQNRLCFTPDVYEQSCEDLVLLPKVLDFLAANERAFVYQEFIWGHAFEYNEASGLSNAAYYARYADALLAGLRARGLADDTLIALTSDHGFRDKGRQRDPEVYRVPLWFHATSLAPGGDARLTSHADFGMLLLETLVIGAPRADDNPLVVAVGPTGQGHTFAIDQAGSHVLLWRRLGGDRVLDRVGATLAPAHVLAAMQRHRARFDAEASRVRAR